MERTESQTGSKEHEIRAHSGPQAKRLLPVLSKRKGEDSTVCRTDRAVTELSFQCDRDLSVLSLAPVVSFLVGLTYRLHMSTDRYKKIHSKHGALWDRQLWDRCASERTGPARASSRTDTPTRGRHSERGVKRGPGGDELPGRAPSTQTTAPPHTDTNLSGHKRGCPRQTGGSWEAERGQISVGVPEQLHSEPGSPAAITPSAEPFPLPTPAKPPSWDIAEA